MIRIWILIWLIVYTNSDQVCQLNNDDTTRMILTKSLRDIDGNNLTYCQDYLNNSMDNYDNVMYIPKSVRLEIEQIADAYNSTFEVKWKINKTDLEKCTISYEIIVSNLPKIFTNKTVVILKKLEKGKLYEIIITPVINGCPLSEFKSAKKFWTTIVPGKPTDLSIQSNLENGFIKLKWNAPQYSDNFTIKYNDKNYTTNKTFYKIDNFTTCKKICANVFTENAKGISDAAQKCFFVYNNNFNKLKIENVDAENKAEIKLKWQYEKTTCLKHFNVSYQDLSSRYPQVVRTNSSHQIMEKLKIGHIYKIVVIPIPVQMHKSSIEILRKPEIRRNEKFFFTGPMEELLKFDQPKVISKFLSLQWSTTKANIENLIRTIEIILTNELGVKSKVYCIVNRKFGKAEYDCDNIRLVDFSTPTLHEEGVYPYSLFKKFKTFHVEYKVVMDLESRTESIGNITISEKFPILEILSGLFLIIAIMMTVIAIIYYNKDQKRRLIRIRRNQEESLMTSDPINLRNRIMRTSTLHGNELDKNYWANCSEKLENFLEKIKGFHVDLEKFCTYYETISINENAELISQYKAIGEEAEKMEKNLNLSRFMGKSPINSKKNRFFNVLPFDQTRVLLVNNPDSETYINANYIPRLDDPNVHEYIASQGPIESMINDFILMIWEQNTRVIVMLTRTVEEDVKKCIQYWPQAIDEEIYFGTNKEFTMKMISEKSESSYIERELLIKYKKLEEENEEERKIVMIHMITWSDYSAPKMDEFTLVLNRFQELTELQSADEGPYLVHCSAGVGRTGTFICLDRIVKQLASGERFVDVFKAVLRLRAYRNFLVQRPAQYIFIHEFLNYYIDKYFSGVKKASSHVSLTCEPQVNLEDIEEANPIIKEE